MLSILLELVVNRTRIFCAEPNRTELSQFQIWPNRTEPNCSARILPNCSANRTELLSKSLKKSAEPNRTVRQQGCCRTEPNCSVHHQFQAHMEFLKRRKWLEIPFYTALIFQSNLHDGPIQEPRQSRTIVLCLKHNHFVQSIPHATPFNKIKK